MLIDKIELDFQVLDTKDPRFLSVADFSYWGQIQNKVSIIEIILPGEKFPITHYFNKKEINIFNSVNLNLNCIDCNDGELTDLPDGVYDITIKGSPDKFFKHRKYLRTEKTQLELDKIYINLNLLCKSKDDSVLKTLSDIELLLRAAESNVRYDNICTAQDLLFKAQELIEKTKGCKSCVGA